MDLEGLLSDKDKFINFVEDTFYDEKTKERLKEIREKGVKNHNLPKVNPLILSEEELAKIDAILDKMDEIRNNN